VVVPLPGIGGERLRLILEFCCLVDPDDRSVNRRDSKEQGEEG
jgi:hypothetical protein